MSEEGGNRSQNAWTLGHPQPRGESSVQFKQAGQRHFFDVFLAGVFLTGGFTAAFF